MSHAAKEFIYNEWKRKYRSIDDEDFPDIPTAHQRDHILHVWN